MLKNIKSKKQAKFETFEFKNDNIILYDGVNHKNYNIEEFIKYIINKNDYFFYSNDDILELIPEIKKLNLNDYEINSNNESFITCRKISDKNSKITISDSKFLIRPSIYETKSCKDLYEKIDKIYKDYAPNVGCKVTIANLAMANFRSNFMNEDIIINGLPKYIEDFIRKSSIRGRREIFKMKSEPNKIVYHYDFNSMYPSVMLEDMPNGKIIHTKTIKEDKIGFYRCLVDVPIDTKIPLLYKKNTELTFPTGKFIGVYDSSEIIEAIKNGTKVKVLYGYYFEDKINLFKEYVNYYYEKKNEFASEIKLNKNILDKSLRDTANIESKFGYEISKLMLICLYGKFIQSRKDNDTTHNKNSNPNYIIPSISMHIASLARIKLYRLMLEHENDILYVNGDSIKTYKKINNNVGNKLGELKLSYCCKNIVYHEPNYYEYDLCDEKGNIIGDRIIKDKRNNNKYLMK